MAVTIDQMAAHLRQLRDETQARADARALTIRARLPEAKQVLMERYGAKRVLLFGSFARGDVTERSDVDLAVEGIDSAGYFTALADLMGLLDSPVDLVEIERAPKSLLARIEVEGIEL